LGKEDESEETSMSSTIAELTHKINSALSEHIEELACAYVKRTNIPPEEAVICYQHDPCNNTMRIWIERRNANG
jgi:hypothetical protein